MIDGVDHDTGLKRGTDYYICAADDYNLSRPGTKVRTQPPIVEKATVSVTTSVLGLTSTGGGPRAYITGHLYESSPHQNIWIVEQQTNSAKPDAGRWQKVSLDFTAPKWGPFINIVFVASASCR